MFVFLCNALQMGDKSCIRKNKRNTLSQRVKKYCKPINMFSLYAVAMCLHFFNNNTKHKKYICVQCLNVDIQMLATKRLHDQCA